MSPSAEQMADRLALLALEEWGEAVDLTDTEVAALCTTPPHAGLVALLGAAVDGGKVRVSPAAAETIAAAWAQRMAWCVQLDALLTRAVAVLGEADIEVRVLKGVAVATLDEPDPSWRSYGDVDLLVPDERLLAAVDALRALGLTPLVAPVSRRWARDHAKSITLLDSVGHQVDVHRRLATGPLGARVSSPALFASGEQFALGDTEVTALAAAPRLLHACYHAVLGGVRSPRHRRDVLLLCLGVTPHDVAPWWAAGWSPTVVADALVWAAVAEHPEVLPEVWRLWLATQTPDPVDQVWIAAARREFGDRAAMYARALPLSARLRFLAALAWPSRAHLRSRGVGRATHVCALLRRAFAGRRRRPTLIADMPGARHWSDVDVPAPAPDACIADFEDGAVLYSPSTQRSVLLNATAAAVWHAVDGRRTVADLTAHLALRYGADPRTVGSDVESSLSAMHHLRFLEGKL